MSSLQSVIRYALYGLCSSESIELAIVNWDRDVILDPQVTYSEIRESFKSNAVVLCVKSEVISNYYSIIHRWIWDNTEKRWYFDEGYNM